MLSDGARRCSALLIRERASALNRHCLEESVTVFDDDIKVDSRAIVLGAGLRTLLLQAALDRLVAKIVDVVIELLLLGDEAFINLTINVTGCRGTL
jgi:hypothetical protein